MAEKKKRIQVFYLKHDEMSPTEVVEKELQGKMDISLTSIRSDRFPNALKILTHQQLRYPFEIVILHLRAERHELGRCETHEGWSTGLRRAEILREKGFAGQILLVNTSASDLTRRIIRGFDQRVNKAGITEVDCQHGGEELLTAVRRNLCERVLAVANS